MRHDETFDLPEPLVEHYGRRHLALGLGAGVSQDSGLPGWNELVCRVAGERSRFNRRAARQLLAKGYHATAVATILHRGFKSDDEFAAAVRAALYQKFAFQPMSTSDDGAFVAHIRRTNRTLHAVGTMCGVVAADGTFAPNPLVRAIVTLNLDELLQLYTRARFKHRVLRTIERTSASASGRLINVYHLHGFLKRYAVRGDAKDLSDESPDRLVLTEQNYFDLVASPNGFVNYTLLHLLREYRFLFIGLSMTDSNLRRALNMSYCERVCELEAEGVEAQDARERSTRHWAVMLRAGRLVDDATTKLLEVLGVTPIWVGKASTIPRLLEKLYRSGGGDWNAVA